MSDTYKDISTVTSQPNPRSLDMCAVSDTIKPPFPWFGGKSKVAPLVWKYLGGIENYVEPFFGSGAVMFGRPTDAQVETINDKDHMVANFWRAVKLAPDAVAEAADNPVNEDDLTARHIWLVKYGIPDLDSRIMADPEYFDAKIAGWWVWGICCWIGSGWCSGNGPWTEEEGQLVHLGDKGQGVNRQLVHLGDKGQGVNRQRVHLGDKGQDELYIYFDALSSRLRNTRVCSGDWARVVTNGALSYGDPVGIFLDPPYSAEADRDMALYNHESGTVAHDVRAWCLANGDNPRYRIALCGYEGEHNELTGHGWTVVEWKSNRAYGNSNGNTVNSDNRKRERVWFSPHCVNQMQKGLF